MAMKRNGKGIYFRSETREILGVADGGANPDDSWIKISDDDTLGLLAARNLIEERKLVDDVTSVDWFGMRAGTPPVNEEMSELIRRFKSDAEASRRDARGGSGLLGRLGARLRSGLGNAGSDDGPSARAVPVRIPVRSRDPKDLHPS